MLSHGATRYSAMPLTSSNTTTVVQSSTAPPSQTCARTRTIALTQTAALLASGDVCELYSTAPEIHDNRSRKSRTAPGRHQTSIKRLSNRPTPWLPTCLELRVVTSEGAIHRGLIGRARRLHRHVYQPPPPCLIDPRACTMPCTGRIGRTALCFGATNGIVLQARAVV